jgi:hypothetical protein
MKPPESMTDRLYFNGIDGATGDYALPPMTPAQLADVISGQEKIDKGLLSELENRFQKHWRIKEGADLNDLAQSGWGIILAAKDKQASEIRDALQELLEHRRNQWRALSRVHRQGGLPAR